MKLVFLKTGFLAALLCCAAQISFASFISLTNCDSILSQKRLKRILGTEGIKAYLASLKTRPQVRNSEELTALVLQYQLYQKKEDLEKIVTSLYPVVFKILTQYTVGNESLLMDLFQAANEGILKAVRNFDVTKSSFLYYVHYYIRSEILKVFTHFKPDKVVVILSKRGTPKRLAVNQFFKNSLVSLGFPDFAAIAQRFGMDVREVEEIYLRRTVEFVSFDAFDKLKDRIPDSSAINEDDIVLELELRIVRNHMGSFGPSLSARDKIIWDERIVAEEPKSLEDLGKVFNITCERVRQLEQRILAKFFDGL